MKIYNSLSRKVEEFKPINPPKIGMYTCGPTVYDYATIGNFRTYTTADLLLRTLQFLGYKVNYVMNLTDVGHLTGDNSGDADMGEDRLEKAAHRERKTAWDIADFYTKAFLSDFEKLNLTKPSIFAKATDHIEDQIKLIKDLEEKSLIYKIDDGIYFDTKEYEAKTGNKYGELSNLDQIKEGARIEINPQKKNPRDFALWKFTPKGIARDMEWDSPWGKGFPGWHIECSAMSMKYLGETFDIHTGGEDLRSTHHPNEIAQSEGATGKKFVNYWVHGAFLRVDGGRMGKSLGNAYNVGNIINKGFDPIALRYLYLTGKYREPLNFTWEALTSAQTALVKLKSQVSNLKIEHERNTLSPEKESKIEEYRNAFTEAISEDLNMPKALAVVWEMLKSNIPSSDKYDLALSFDEVLGLKLSERVNKEVPEDVKILLEKREKLRRSGRFAEADEVRNMVIKLGYTVSDAATAK